MDLDDVVRNLDRKLLLCSIAITGIGTIVSFCLLSNIKFDVMYLLVPSVCLLCIFAILYIYKIVFHQIIFKKLEFILDINEDGSEADLTKIKTIKVIQKNITSLYDKNFLGANLAGKLAETHFIESKISGSPTSSLNMSYNLEGASFTLFSSAETPLPRKKDLTHSIKVKFINCFLSNTESFAFTVDKRYRNAKVTINFPSSRPCKKAWVRWHLSNGEFQDLGEIGSRDQQHIEYETTNPQYGTKYSIYWTW